MKYIKTSTILVYKPFYLQQDGDNVRFMLEDNGLGCEEIMFGFGLTTMRERIEEAGGTLLIHTEPKNGCRIEIRIPWVK